MTNRTAAHRYARALLDIVLTEAVDPAQVDAELASFVDLFARHKGLEKVLLSPVVPASQKRSAIAAIASQSGAMPVVQKLLVLLAERNRLVILPGLLSAYRDRLMDQQRVVRAEVTSAVALTSERTATIQRRLAEVTGRTVRLSARVDPALIGGMVARVGSTVYDGSVAVQLEKLKARLSDTF
jgi:F-type H+-transporting ATPase subunit delta